MDEEVEAAAEEEEIAMQPVDFTMKKKRHRQQLDSPTIDVGTEQPAVVTR